MPACRQCNQAYGRLEENLLIRLGMCLDDDAEPSMGIGKRALDALNALRARNPRDFAIRHAKALKLLAESKNLTTNTDPMILNSGPASVGVVIESADLRRLGEKFVRGIIWVKLKQVVDNSHQIKVMTGQGPSPRFDEATRQFGLHYGCGPGIEVYFENMPPDNISGRFFIKIFGRLVIRAVVMPQSIPPA